MQHRIRLPRLHMAQERVISEARRFNVVVCGRRWGKTLLGVDRAIMCGLLRSTPVGWFAPTYKYLMEPWRDMVRLTGPQLDADPLAIRVNQSERRIECHGGGTIEFWSLDDPDAGRSRAYGLVIVDEAAMVLNLTDVWQASIMPTLADHCGAAWFYSTPKGYDDFHALYEMGQDPAHQDWQSWRMPTSTNPRITAAELESMRAQMDAHYFAQEFEASFEQMTGRVYIQFDRTLNVRDDLADTGGDLLIGMDFNVNPMSAVIAVRAADQLHVLDELELENSNTEEMARALVARYPDRRISIYPDPSGSARKTSAPVGQTDFAILKRAGFSIKTPNAAPPVVDRVNEVNALCCNADKRRRLFVRSKCRSLIRSLSQLSYKDGVSVIDKSTGLDHMVDALGYLVHVEFPLVIQRGGGQATRALGV